MKILVVASTRQEVTTFADLNPGVEILICGVGIPSTIFHLTKKLLQQKYDLVIQAGIGGSFSGKLKKGAVVAIETDAFADLGVEEKKKFTTIFQMGFGDKNEFPFINGRLPNPSGIIAVAGLKKVNAVTINTIHDNKKRTTRIKKMFNASVESMEGAAFHFVCLQLNVPFLQLRAISNTVGERDKSKWKINDAIGNLNHTLQTFIESINTL